MNTVICEFTVLNSVHHNGVIDGTIFYFEKGCKMGPNSEILHIWKLYRIFIFNNNLNIGSYVKMNIMIFLKI
jgi:hypothetical protein